MSTKAESADLIMKLYDLRREATMRKARDWMFTFNPTSAEEYSNTMMDPEVGAYLRMVTSYWDMAATFVNHGAIDADMFSQTSGEHMVVFAKIEPLLADLRAMWQAPEAMANLEKVIMDAPDGAERLKRMQDWLSSMAPPQAEEAAA
ncbi:MAG: hypothetical protein ABL959_21135 [Pyrinomonadaceae bacterium]